MLLQQKISRQNNKLLMGKTVKVLVEGRDPKHPNLWRGRSWMDAPEVDGNVFIQTNQKLLIGSFASARIVATKDYDLVGEL